MRGEVAAGDLDPGRHGDGDSHPADLDTLLSSEETTSRGPHVEASYPEPAWPGSSPKKSPSASLS